MAGRLYKFDNLKTILIFLVVFGHFLELVEGHRLLYLIIYSFHMPLFLFISGYFARFDRKNIWSKMIYPYVIFQILYTYFERYLLGAESLKLTLVKPRWILWYLFALIVYYLVLPLFDTESYKVQCAVMTGTLLAALLSGYDSKIGYDFSAARILTFMPFFLSGYYLSKKKAVFLRKKLRRRNSYYATLIGSILLIVIMVRVLSMGKFSPKMLYGSYSYEAAGYTVQMKLLLYIFAGAWIMVLVMLMPNKKLPVLSTIGRCTMPIFLLHGFVVKLVDMHYDKAGGKLPIVFALIFSIIIVVLLGNRFAGRVFDIVFTGKWIERGVNRCRKKD